MRFDGPPLPIIVALAALLPAGAAAAGCRDGMLDQPRYEALEASAFFADGMAARRPVPGTVARGQLFEDDHLHRGRVDGGFARTFPFEVTRAVLDQGRERYDIFCSPCHSRTGGGDGMIVRRGFPAPRSFHAEVVRRRPPGYYFDVITNGFGQMPEYGGRIEPRERWAIIAYIRALQLSQSAPREVWEELR